MTYHNKFVIGAICNKFLPLCINQKQPFSFAVRSYLL
jgi:hypothetical protein